MTKQHRKRRPLRIESLENRYMLDGGGLKIEVSNAVWGAEGYELVVSSFSEVDADWPTSVGGLQLNATFSANVLHGLEFYGTRLDLTDPQIVGDGALDVANPPEVPFEPFPIVRSAPIEEAGRVEDRDGSAEEESSPSKDGFAYSQPTEPLRWGTYSWQGPASSGSSSNAEERLRAVNRRSAKNASETPRPLEVTRVNHQSTEIGSTEDPVVARHTSERTDTSSETAGRWARRVDDALSQQATAQWNVTLEDAAAQWEQKTPAVPGPRDTLADNANAQSNQSETIMDELATVHPTNDNVTSLTVVDRPALPPVESNAAKSTYLAAFVFFSGLVLWPTARSRVQSNDADNEGATRPSLR